MIDFNKYESLVKKIELAINNIWSTVSFITVADIVANDVNLSELDNKSMELATIIRKANRSLSDEINLLNDADYDTYQEEQSKLEDLINIVDYKCMAVDSIISKLKNIEETIEDDKIRDMF